jgi:Leucine-rich repeat (LRR) protein
MGSKTIVALKKFQSDHSLPVTGKLDQKTTALLSRSSKPGSLPKPSDNSDAIAGGANAANDAVQPLSEGGLNFNSTLPLRVWADKGDGDEIIGTTPASTALWIPKCRWWAIEPLKDVGVAALQEDVKAFGIKGLKIRTATGQDLDQLKGWAGLQFLDLSSSTVGDAELASLGDLESLRFLRLRDTDYPGPLASGKTGSADAAFQVSVQISDSRSGNDPALKVNLELAATRDGRLELGANDICVVTKDGVNRCSWYFTDKIFAGLTVTNAVGTWYQQDGGFHERWSVQGAFGINMSHGWAGRDVAELYFLGIRSSDVAGFKFGNFAELSLAPKSPLVNLMRLKGLETLDLSWTKIGDACLADLASLPRLHDLDLDSTPITDNGLSYVQGLGGLRSLSMRGTAVTDAGLAKIKTLKGLRTLSVGGTYGTTSNITDAGLEELEELQGLRRLNLANTRITDSGIAHLVELKNLELIRK